MTDNLSKYEGYTPGPWSEPEYDCTPGDQGWWIRNGRAGSDEYAVAVTFYGNPRDVADARLIADAPLLLAEVRRLREENEQQRKTIERYAQWDAQRQRNVDLAAQLTALRQSHARLLKEMYFQRERWVLLKQVPDDPGDQAACAIRNLDAAVAEAEAL